MRRRILSLAFFLFLIVPFLLSSTVKVWQVKGKGFLSGEPKTSSITGEGEIVIAPLSSSLFKPDAPRIWALAVGAGGELYLGTGSEGKVFRVSPQGKGSLFFKAPEMEIYALAFSKSGSLFVASSPRGKIYRVSPSGSAVSFFNPRKRYIWSLAFDPAGNLYAGTGDSGSIFKVDPAGKGDLHYETKEDHITALFWHPAGFLLAGTAGSGLVLKVEGKNKASVLWDTPFYEVKAFAVDDKGMIYAAAVKGGKKASPSSSEGEEKGTKQEVKDEFASVVYRISPDGKKVEEVLKLKKERVFSLAYIKGRGVFVGTGSKGTLLLIDEEGKSSLIMKVSQKDITALAPTGNTLFIGTSNSSELLKLEPKFRAKGIYLSPVKDTKTISRFGRISFSGRTPTGTYIRLFTRSGNSEKPDATWSPWSPPYLNPEGSEVKSPPARFIQFRAELVSENPKLTPRLHSVSLFYLPQNLPPKVNKIVVYPPGIYFKREAQYTNELLALLPPGYQSHLEKPLKLGRKPSAGEDLGKMLYRKGMLTFLFKGVDPNGDELRYSLFVRGEGERNWMPLIKDLSRPFYSWDTESVPDGRYQLKVVVSDVVTNPAHPLSTEKISDFFVVDNTPPKLSVLQVIRGKGRAVVSFSASDELSFIKDAWYSIDAGKWERLSSVDGMLDSRKESFKLRLPSLAPGEHIIVVKVEDSSYNIGVRKAVIK
ncbi:MAG: hypothetical protein J7L64_00850 [Acidobacteria bacterium]|nr:hypothetical protein [Acidobacteriota bacterium]